MWQGILEIVEASFPVMGLLLVGLVVSPLSWLSQRLEKKRK